MGLLSSAPAPWTGDVADLTPTLERLVTGQRGKRVESLQKNVGQMNKSVRPDLGPARDFFGYGPHPPHPHWPGDARIAINFNLNFEAGGERSLLEGDNQTEDMLNDIGFPAYYGVRSPIVESVFEYGPRVGRVAPVANLQTVRRQSQRSRGRARDAAMPGGGVRFSC